MTCEYNSTYPLDTQVKTKALSNMQQIKIIVLAWNAQQNDCATSWYDIYKVAHDPPIWKAFVNLIPQSMFHKKKFEWFVQPI
jgi:hypothetical protein